MKKSKPKILARIWWCEHNGEAVGSVCLTGKNKHIEAVVIPVSDFKKMRRKP